MSVPVPSAFGNSCSSASSSAPEPVPMSRMRNFSRRRPPRTTKSSAASTTRFGFRPRHQHVGRDVEHQRSRIPCWPRMRDTGSCFSRRAASASISAAISRASSRRSDCAISRARVEGAARAPISSARIGMPEFDTGEREALRQRSAAPRDADAPAFSPATVLTPRLRPPAVRPDARSPARR